MRISNWEEKVWTVKNILNYKIDKCNRRWTKNGWRWEVTSENFVIVQRPEWRKRHGEKTVTKPLSHENRLCDVKSSGETRKELLRIPFNNLVVWVWHFLVTQYSLMMWAWELAEIGRSLYWCVIFNDPCGSLGQHNCKRPERNRMISNKRLA